MDSVSHSCFSYLTCRASGVASSPRTGLLAAGVALLPDLDFLIIPFLPELWRFAFHRGPSHSLMMALVMGVILGGLVSRWLRLSWLRASLLVGLAWMSHIFLDMCTGFGVALLWPFTHARYSFDLLFVVDPLATLPLIVAVIWDLCANGGKTDGRRKIATGALFLFGVYAMASLGIRTKVKHDFLVALRQHGHQVREIHTEPTPFNNQLWYLCAKTEDGFVITYRSFWDGDDWERWTEVPLIQKPLNTFADNPLPAKMEVVLEDWFTCRVIDEDQIDVIDLRLGKRYGWEDDEAPYVFIYQIQRTATGELSWSINKPGSRYDFGRLAGLLKRITGQIPEHRLKPHSSVKK